VRRPIKELEGEELDAAVRDAWGIPTADDLWAFGLSHFYQLSPSTSWHQGGVIIERARIHLVPWPEGWGAICGGSHGLLTINGPTPLIAAMRAFVVSRAATDDVRVCGDKLRAVTDIDTGNDR
jgi:hypothetical protein